MQWNSANPIRDRSRRPDEMQDERKTSRSQEISVNSFNEEPSSSDRTGRPVETEEIQARSPEDSKRLNVQQTHDRTGRPVNDTVAVQDDPQAYHEARTLNIDDETLRERIEADMDFRIPGLPHSVVTHAQSASVRELIQKIENHPNRHALQRDLRQSQSFNPFSTESKQMIHEVGNIELCELLETENKTQCKVCLSCWDIGIVYCTCGHFLRNGTEENKKFVKYTRSPVDSQLLHQERATPPAPLREEAGGSRVLHREFAQEEMQEETFLGYSRPVHP